MELTPGTKLHDLLKAHPFLLDFLVRLTPAFGKLKNPVMRNTVGRVASLSQAARMGDVPLEKLLSDIAAEIRRVTNEDVSVALQAVGGEEPLTREARHEILKDIIRDLHSGQDLERLKKRFAALIENVSPAEISEMEQRLIQEGMPVEEVQRLCDVHVQVFKESLDSQKGPDVPPGHPLHTLWAENRALERILGRAETLLAEATGPGGGTIPAGLKTELEKAFASLAEVDKHFLKKENQLFPVLEDRGVSGPSKVMWGVDNEIRGRLKEASSSLASGDATGLAARGKKVLTELRDMIYKEEKILFPMSLETLEAGDWARVKRGEEEVGYAWGVVPGRDWRPEPAGTEDAPRIPYEQPLARLPLDTGALSLEQVNLILKNLPLDVTLVDEEDRVRYYSDGKERIFPRSRAVIGRKVQDCHPASSLHVVNRILEAFRKGEKDVADFWINLKGRFVLIRYFAVRDGEGRYRGCLEVSQDATDIRALRGERRLLDWE